MGALPVDDRVGKVVLAYPVDDAGMVFPDAALLKKLAPDAAAMVVVEADYDILHGPNLLTCST